jgi:putative transposase
MTQKEIDELQKKALEQFKSGESLFGKDGAFAPMLKGFIEAALEGEMQSHLSEQERSEGNKRNGKGHKTIKSASGSFDVSTPQDRKSSFEPQLIKKRQTVMADSLEEKIIGLYGLGMSLRDISSHIKEMYDTELSHNTLSEITDRIIPELKQWQSRPLEPVYCIIWLDAMHFKVREDGRVKQKALYNILGVNPSGHKEVLGCYVAESESSRFWLNVLTDLNNRGLQDILIVCIDGLTGFSEAISSIYPQAQVQRCVIHQIRNSLKYVASKDQKAFMKDLKTVYRAETLSLAEQNLEQLSERWQDKYPIVLQSWRDNWDDLTTYFQYNPLIRKIIYTTNTVEGYHRQMRKVTKTKGAFSNDTALLKLVYLATRNIQKKWTAPLQNWGLTVQQLAITFGDRLPLDLVRKNSGGTP